jgi:hypothetical protein
MWADQIRAGDVVRWPYPDSARSLIHERDIAAVAVQALIREEFIGTMPVISGPEAITQADQVEPARRFRDWAGEHADDFR